MCGHLKTACNVQRIRKKEIEIERDRTRQRQNNSCIRESPEEETQSNANKGWATLELLYQVGP